MKIKFTKMTGAGNDFVMIDNRDGKLNLTPAQVAKICDRHFGVGGDGLLLAEAGTAETDFKMVYHNADGSAADMCGNGARCFARFVQPFKKEIADHVSFQTGAGRVVAQFHGEEVAITLTAPHSLSTNIKLPTSSGDWIVHSLNTGVPHVVCFVENAETIEIDSLGSEMRYHLAFQPKGTNVNFVQKTGRDSIKVRTYERGVEGETLACGTGVTAAAIIAHDVEGITKPVKVEVRSGEVMTVDFDKKGEAYENVVLQGPATQLFTGELELR